MMCPQAGYSRYCLPASLYEVYKGLNHSAWHVLISVPLRLGVAGGMQADCCDSHSL